VLTLLVFLVVLVLVMSAVGRIARVGRRRAFEEEQRRPERPIFRSGVRPKPSVSDGGGSRF
jgi:Na+-transporting methylmalonyl-CoA/oxaloacetate decarboxylase gamma subunit